MTLLGRFRACAQGESVDRLPRIEWAPWWDKTITSWQSKGLPIKEYDVYEIQKFWGLDPLIQLYISSQKGGPAPLCHGASLCTNEKEYEALLEFLYPHHAHPSEEFLRYSKMAADNLCLTWLTVDDFFWFPRALFGIEGHLYAFYDHPDLMHRMNQDQADYIKKIAECYSDLLSPAFITLGEDMSYNHGPMLSKKLFAEFLAPYYRQVVPVLRQAFDCLVIVDSDGLVDELIPWLIEVGVDGILPLERQSGVDAAVLREKYPDLIMIGHFDIQKTFG